MWPVRVVLNLILICLVLIIIHLGFICFVNCSATRIKTTTNYNYLVNHDIHVDDMPDPSEVLSDPKVVESNKL